MNSRVICITTCVFFYLLGLTTVKAVPSRKSSASVNRRDSQTKIDAGNLEGLFSDDSNQDLRYPNPVISKIAAEPVKGNTFLQKVKTLVSEGVRMLRQQSPITTSRQFPRSISRKDMRNAESLFSTVDDVSLAAPQVTSEKRISRVGPSGVEKKVVKPK